jgi:hypothetical protein
MTRVKAVLLGSGAALALLLAFGCPLAPSDDAGTGQGLSCNPQRYIKLQIEAPRTSKGIMVSDFEVTRLSIQVLGPRRELLKTIIWYAREGPRTYLIQPRQPGGHEIDVVHVGRRGGEAVAVPESIFFDVRVATLITVVRVVPGCVGMILIEEGEAV